LQAFFAVFYTYLLIWIKLSIRKKLKII
jgi:hypothetical protein